MDKTTNQPNKQIEDINLERARNMEFFIPRIYGIFVGFLISCAMIYMACESNSMTGVGLGFIFAVVFIVLGIKKIREFVKLIKEANKISREIKEREEKENDK